MIRKFFIIASLIPSALDAQVIGLENTYRKNDILIGRQIDVPPFDMQGTHLVWDVSQWIDNISNNSCDYIVRFDGVEGKDDKSITATEQETCYTYCLQGNALFVCGFENRLSKMVYDQQECYLKFPLFYGDSIEGYFHGLGSYCDRLSLRHYGRYKTKVEGSGSLVIGDGDTLRNVLCLHTERIMSSQLTEISQFDSLQIYTTDSITNHLDTDSDLIQMDVYRWYADGYRYPVLEIRIRHDLCEESVLTESAYYYSPSEQALFTNDPANEQARVFTRGGFRLNDYINQEAPSDYSFNPQQPYSLTKTADGQNAIFGYLVPKEMMVSYALYAIDGYLLAQCPAQLHEGGSYNVPISLHGTSSKVYLLDMTLGDEHLTRKIIIRK